MNNPWYYRLLVHLGVLHSPSLHFAMLCPRLAPCRRSVLDRSAEDLFEEWYDPDAPRGRRTPNGADGPDSVNHPAHYTSSPARCPRCGSGIECITITEHMGFCIGNAVKYLWRVDLKDDAIEDLRKARWYIDREIARRDAL